MVELTINFTRFWAVSMSQYHLGHVTLAFCVLPCVVDSVETTCKQGFSKAVTLTLPAVPLLSVCCHSGYYSIPSS